MEVLQAGALVNPFAVLLTGGNRNDVTQLLPLLDAIPSVRGRIGRPRRKPDSLFTDRGYDDDVYRNQVRDRGIVPAIARRGTRHGTGWAPIAGWSSGVSRGCTASDVCGSAGNGGPTSMKRSSNSPAASSPTDNSAHCVSRCYSERSWRRLAPHEVISESTTASTRCNSWPRESGLRSLGDSRRYRSMAVCRRVQASAAKT